jgi:DNA-binding protein HU-beta
MNKAQLSEAVARELGVPLSHGARHVDAVLDVIGRELLLGNSVSVTGFGTFEVVHRDERTARNPQDGSKVTVPERDVARWRPGQRLLDLLNGKPVHREKTIATKAPKGSLAGGAR